MRQAAALFLILPLAGFAQTGIFEGHGDVGTVLHAGSVEYLPSSHAYRLTASGENVWGTSDAFQFAWKKMSGDVSIAADIAFPNTEGDQHKKALLMIRQSLDADSAYADAALHGNGMTSLQARDAKGAATYEIEANVTAPQRLRLTKKGDNFYLSIAAAGEELHPAGGSMRVPIQGEFYVGIGLSAHNKDDIRTATFSDIRIEPVRNAAGKQYSTLETAPISGVDCRAVYTAPEQMESPMWTNGNILLFHSGDRAYRISPEGGKPQTSTGNAEPPVPPAGEYIYFAQERDGRMQLFRRKPDRGEPEQLTSDQLNNAFPQVSPDGQRIAFLSYEKEPHGEMSLRVLTLADRSIKLLAKFTGGPHSMDAPSWSPDGKRVAFVSYQVIPQL
jgi:hypothetical protein